VQRMREAVDGPPNRTAAWRLTMFGFQQLHA
jgi:hypothetical protein